MSKYQNGARRERDVVRLLRGEGWHAIRTPASQGVEDVLAVKRSDVGCEALLVQVKANAGSPWKSFGPASREQLDLEAIRCGAKAMLVHWPPDRKGPRWIDSSAWPD